MEELDCCTPPLRLQKFLGEIGKSEENLIEMMMVLVQTLEERDDCTKGHSERVATLAVLIAETLSLEELVVERIKRGSLLHDIGKIGIPDQLLNKPGLFTPEERAKMNQHPEKGHFIVLKSHLLWDLIPMIRNHHENFDGSGYPDQLKGEGIPVEVRIVSLADYFDALATERPYKKAFSKKMSLSYIQEMTGKKFDPYIVKGFMKVVDNFYSGHIPRNL